jgi:hypothetical protein
MWLRNRGMVKSFRAAARVALAGLADMLTNLGLTEHANRCQ